MDQRGTTASHYASAEAASQSPPGSIGDTALSVAVQSQHGAVRRGMLLMLVAVSLLPVMDAIAKELAVRYPVLQVTWGRYVFTLLCILPQLLWRYRTELLDIPQPGLQLVRGLAQLAATFLFFLTLTFLPLADTVALAFLYPLIVTALAPFVLAERVGWRRQAAVVIGFLGALVIIRPGFEVFQPASIFGLGIGLAFAVYVLLTRKLRGRTPPLVTLGWVAIIGVVGTSVVMPFVFVPMAPADWLGMAMIGLLGALAHQCIIRAFEMAPVSVLSPLGYAEILMAVLIGYLWFGDFPDGFTWAGILIIAGAGLYVGWRERHRD
jgi:drug/metabolite transporter (DMT)-like permease